MNGYQIIEKEDIPQSAPISGFKIYEEDELTPEQEHQAILQNAPSYSSLAPEYQKKVKDIFFEMNPHLPKGRIGDLIFNLGAHLSEPQKEFKPKNNEEKKGLSLVNDYFYQALKPLLPFSEGAPEAFARAAGRSAIQGTGNVANLVFPDYPKIKGEDIIPIQKSEQSHPLASTAGNLVGYLGPYEGVGGAVEALPGVASVIQKAAPFILKRIATQIPKGFISGYTTGNEGERLKAGALGAGLSPIMGEIFNAATNIPKALSKWWSGPDIKALLTKEIPAKEAAEKAEQQLAETRKLSSIEHEGTTEPEGLIRQVNKHQQELADAKQRLRELEPVANNNLLSKEEIANMEVEHGRNLRNAQNDVETSDSALRDYLGEGEEHGTTISDELLDMEDANRKEISQGYENKKTQLKNEKIKLSNPDSALSIASDVKDLINDGTFRGVEVKKAISDFDSALGNKTGEIPADKFMTMLQTARQLEYEAWKNARLPNQEGGTAQSRAEWEEKAQDLSDKIERMDKAFEKGIGDKHYADIKALNQRWKNEVIPLRKNANFRSLQRRQQAPGNFLNSLRGGEEGNVLLRDMIKRNPRALRAIIGQKFAANPAKLHAPNETLDEYVKALDEFPPEGDLQAPFSFLKESHATSLKNLKTAKENFDFFKEKSSGFKEQAAEKQKAITEKTAAEKRIEELTKKMADKEKTIKKLQIAEKRRDVTLAEHLSIKKQIEEAKKSKKEIAALLTKITVGVGLLGGGAYTANKYTSGDF